MVDDDRPAKRNCTVEVSKEVTHKYSSPSSIRPTSSEPLNIISEGHLIAKGTLPNVQSATPTASVSRATPLTLFVTIRISPGCTRRIVTKPIDSVLTRAFIGVFT